MLEIEEAISSSKKPEKGNINNLKSFYSLKLAINFSRQYYTALNSAFKSKTKESYLNVLGHIKISGSVNKRSNRNFLRCRLKE